MSDLKTKRSRLRKRQRNMAQNGTEKAQAPTKKPKASTESSKAPTLTFANSPELSRLQEAFISGEAVLDYPALSEIVVLKQIGADLLRQIIELKERDGLAGICLRQNADAANESSGQAVHVKLKQVLKCSAAIKKVMPHSISMLSFVPAPTADDPGFNCAINVATLELYIGDRTPDQLPPVRPLSRASTASHGTRPELPAYEIANPTDEQIRNIVDEFIGMHKTYRNACQRIAREEKHSTWRAQEEARNLAVFGIRALTPLRKALFGAGVGDVMLKVAMTAPLARAAAAKKRDGLSREKVTRLLWEYAYNNRRPQPPFVEL